MISSRDVYVASKTIFVVCRGPRCCAARCQRV